MTPERLRAMYAAIDANAWSALEEFLDPEVVYRRPGYAPLDGAAEVLHFYRHVRIIGSGTHTLRSIVAGPTELASFGVFVGHARDGTPLREEFADYFQCRDGRVVGRQSYFFRPAV